MVSKARLDLPEPESPVTTMSLSRGISREMFLRLCTRAPCMAMVVRAAVLAEAAAVLELIMNPHMVGQPISSAAGLPAGWARSHVPAGAGWEIGMPAGFPGALTSMEASQRGRSM